MTTPATVRTTGAPLIGTGEMPACAFCAAVCPSVHPSYQGWRGRRFYLRRFGRWAVLPRRLDSGASRNDDEKVGMTG